MVVEVQDQVNEDPSWENELALWCSEDLYVPPRQESWYGKLSYPLHHGTFLENINPNERTSFRLKSTQYCLINSMLFHINYDGVLIICLKHEDIEKVLKELHDDTTDGNFVWNTTAHKILSSNYYWPTLFRDAHTHARNCKTCQMSTRRENRATVPLQPVVVSKPFKQWGLYVIG